MSNNKKPIKGDFEFDPETGKITLLLDSPELKPFFIKDSAGKGDGWEIADYIKYVEEENNKDFGWIIESVEHKGKIYPHEYWVSGETPNHGFNGNSYGYFISSKIRPDYFKIHSVKRLSDNQIFTLGEEHGGESYDNGRTILEFFIDGGELLVKQKHGDTKFSNLRKLPLKKQPLFTTSDGKDVYGDTKELWRVFTVPHSFEMWKPYNIGIPNAPIEGEVYFSTESAAKEYILLNKPVLSVNDIKEVGELAQCAGSKMVLISFEKLEAFAKSKIDKP